MELGVPSPSAQKNGHEGRSKTEQGGEGTGKKKRLLCSQKPWANPNVKEYGVKGRGGVLGKKWKGKKCERGKKNTEGVRISEIW